MEVHAAEALMVFKKDLIHIKQQIQEDLSKKILNTSILAEIKGEIKTLTVLGLISTEEAMKILNKIENKEKMEMEKKYETGKETHQNTKRNYKKQPPGSQ